MCAREGPPLARAEVLVPVRLAPGPELAGLGDDRPVRLELLDLAPAGIEPRGSSRRTAPGGPLAAARVIELRAGSGKLRLGIERAQIVGL